MCEIFRGPLPSFCEIEIATKYSILFRPFLMNLFLFCRFDEKCQNFVSFTAIAVQGVTLGEKNPARTFLACTEHEEKETILPR